MPTADHAILRPLAARWMELACLPVMAERRRLWTALHDLRPERPMVLFETWTLLEYVRKEELQCEDPLFRSVEATMRQYIRQAEEIGDDIVLNPFWRLNWDITCDAPDYGVGLRETHADDAHGADVGYTFNHPLQTPEDVGKLKQRSWTVDRAATYRRQERLQEAFGDVLPVEIHGTGGLHMGITGEVFKLIGNDKLLLWTYDAPDALRALMAYLREDRMRYARWLEAERLLGWNNNTEICGSGSPGFTTALPLPDAGPHPRLKDLWVFMESQETSMISPAMFARLFLPDMAEICKLFGLVYYGCCEPVHDRWNRIVKPIPHVRSVSVSPWCNMPSIAEQIGRERVFSRKPKPWAISGPTPDWDALQQDVDETIDAARDCNLEFIFRDVYQIHGDRARLRKWVELVRSRIGGKFL